MARTKASSAHLAKVRRQSEREASAARLTMGAPSRLKRTLEQAGCDSDEEDPVVIDLSSELSEEQLDVIDPHSPLKAVSKKRRVEGGAPRADFADAATMTAPFDGPDQDGRNGRGNGSGRTTPEPTAQTAPQSPFVPNEHTPPDRPSKAGGSGAKRPARHCAEDEAEDEQWTALIDITTGKVASLSRSSSSATTGVRQSSAVRILSMKQMPSPVDAASTAAWPETPLCKIIRQKYDQGKSRTPVTVEIVTPDTLDSDDFALYEGLRPQSVDNRFGSDEVVTRAAVTKGPPSGADNSEKHTPASQTGIAPDSGYYSDLRSSR